MNRTEILRQFSAIAREVFDNDALEIAESTTAKDVEGWDSLTHVNLIVALEKHFKISFTTREVMGLQCVGDLVRLIARHLA